MGFLEGLFNFFTAEMPEPTNYGWFHILSLAIIIAFTVFLCKKFTDCSDKTFRKITLITWIVLVALEVYKQITFGLSYTDGEFIWDYAWYSFPYQFCSTPLYALPFVAFLPDGQIRDAFSSLIGFLSFLSGLAVMFYRNYVIF